MSEAHAATVRVRQGFLCEAVLVRILGAMAAQADLPVDRLADAQIVAEAISRQGSRHSADGALQVGFSWTPRRVCIAVGPLSPGGATRLLEESAVPGVGPVLERVSDEVSTHEEDEGELLELVIGAGEHGGRGAGLE